jgi:hypothetical protein
MGRWNVSESSGVITLTLEGTLSKDDMQAFVVAHNKTIEGMQGRDYKVFCDLRRLAPLNADCAALMESAKSFSSSQPNFRGSAVWVESSIVAMQHKRTSASGGVLETELISEDEGMLRAHLAKVYRK